MPSTTVALGSARELFELVALPNFQAFLEHRSDPRAAMNAVIAFTHLLDWTVPNSKDEVRSRREKDDARSRHKKALIAKHSEIQDIDRHLNALLDLANGLKHMHRDGKKIGADALQRDGFRAGDVAGASLRTLVVMDEAGRIVVDRMLASVCALWHAEMVEQGWKPPGTERDRAGGGY